MKHKIVQKQNPIMLVLAIAQVLLLLTLVIQVSGMDLSSSDKDVKTGDVEDVVAPTPTEKPSEPGIIDMSKFKGHTKGDADAPITIIEWSDFECPFCARFSTQTYPSIVSDYVDTGKVKIIFKHFPLSFHANAQKAGEATECAADQDKFWEMHDKIFTEGVVGGVPTFKLYAAALGLDTADFNACLDSGEKAAILQADMNEGVANGITGTPGFLIAGLKVSGAQPYTVFQQAIDAALN